MPKKGRMSNEERQFILDNAGMMSPAEIATKLDRTEEVVAHTLSTVVGTTKGTPEQMEVRKELRESVLWTELNKQFTKDEIAYFEERYAAIFSQFREDLMATEETQIFLLLKTEILINRNLADKQRMVHQLSQLEKMLDNFYRTHPKPEMMSDADKAYAINLNEQVTAVRGAQQSKTIEFVKLEEKHAALLKELKATREQRKKGVEQSKVGFIDVVKFLMSEENREQSGREYELLRMAALKERERLSHDHKYADGMVDKPLLTSDTIGVEDSE